MYISEIRTKAPADERMPLERKFYDTLEKLKIPFDTSSFSKKLGVSHMSFAPPEKMLEHLGTTPGSASVAGLLTDEDDYVQVIIDKEVAEAEWFGCNPGINTSHLKFKTKDLLQKYLPAIHHRARIVDL